MHRRANEQSKDMQIELKVNFVSVKHAHIEITLASNEKRVPLLEYSDNLKKIVNIMAFVKRFVRHCRDKVLTKRVSKTRLIQLKNKKHLKTFIGNEIELPSEQEKGSAMQFFISHEQAISYPKEIAYCKEKMRE